MNTHASTTRTLGRVMKHNVTFAKPISSSDNKTKHVPSDTNSCDLKICVPFHAIPLIIDSVDDEDYVPSDSNSDDSDDSV